MPPKGASVLDGLAEEALRLGADTLELEYKDRHEEEVAIKGNVGVGIAQFGRGPGRPSSMVGCSVPGPPALRRTR